MTTTSQDKITVPGDDRLTKLNVSTKTPFWTKIPIIKELRVAVGWQKGMLITGLAITAFFLLVALFAPLIAPYGHAQIKAADGTSFPAQAAPSAEHIWGTTAAGVFFHPPESGYAHPEPHSADAQGAGVPQEVLHRGGCAVNACGMLLAAVVACAMLQPAHAAVKDQSPNGFTLENSQWVPVDQARAWKVFVHDVGKWWPSDHTWWGDASRLSISEQAGGCFCELNGALIEAQAEARAEDPAEADA